MSGVKKRDQMKTKSKKSFENKVVNGIFTQHMVDEYLDEICCKCSDYIGEYIVGSGKITDQEIVDAHHYGINKETLLNAIYNSKFNGLFSELGDAMANDIIARCEDHAEDILSTQEHNELWNKRDALQTKLNKSLTKQQVKDIREFQKMGGQL